MSPLAFKSGFLIDFTDFEGLIKTIRTLKNIFLDFCTW